MTSRTIVVLACAALLASVACARSGGRAEVAGEPVVITRDTCRGLWILPLEWTSEESGRVHELVAVFDTGATTAYIDPDSLEHASGTRVATGERVSLEGVTVGGARFTRFRPRVRELDHLGRALGRPFDVFLPFDTFDDFLLTLDYPASEMRIARGSLPAPDGVEVFSADGRDRRPWLSVEVAGGRRRLLVDSGSTGTIALDRDTRLDWAADPVPLRLAHGMSDNELSPVGRLADDLTIGPLVFEQPVVSLTRDTELIGWQVLRRFVITFDQRNERLRMSPAGPGPVRLEPQRGTGAVLQVRPEGAEVVRLLPGTPAEHAGLRPGDVLTHADGRLFTERGCADDEDEPEQVTYTVLRDGRAFDVTVDVVVLVP